MPSLFPLPPTVATVLRRVGGIFFLSRERKKSRLALSKRSLCIYSRAFVRCLCIRARGVCVCCAVFFPRALVCAFFYPEFILKVTSCPPLFESREMAKRFFSARRFDLSREKLFFVRRVFKKFAWLRRRLAKRLHLVKISPIGGVPPPGAKNFHQPLFLFFLLMTASDYSNAPAETYEKRA